MPGALCQCGAAVSVVLFRVRFSRALCFTELCRSGALGHLSCGSENPACQKSFLEPHQELFKEDKAQTLIFFMQNFHKSCYF